MTREATPMVPVLVPISLEEASRLDNSEVVYFVTYVNWEGKVTTEARTRININGGVCDCCSESECIAIDIQKPDTIVRAYRYEFTSDFDADALLVAWAKAKAASDKAKAEHAAKIREKVRERGTPVLDRLRAQADARRSARFGGKK